MTSNGGRLYLSQYDDLVAGRFGVQPPNSIWRSTIVDEDFTGMGYSHLGYYYLEFKQECIKGKRINDLMDWLDDIVVYHRLFDSNYTPFGIDVTSTGFTWKINDGLGLVDYTPVAPSNYTGQLDGYPWNDDYIWKQLRGAITLVCQNVNIVPPHDMGEFNGGEKDWFKYLQTIDVDSKNRFISYLNQYYQNVLVTEDVLIGFTGIPSGTIRYTIEGSGVICPSRWLLTGISPEGYKQESITGFQNTNYSGGYVYYNENYAIDRTPITEGGQATGDGIWLPQTNNKNQPTPLDKKILPLNEGKQPYYELGQYGKPFKTEYLQYFPDTSGVENAGNTTVHIKPHDEMVFTSFVLSKSGGASASGDLHNYDDVDQYGNYSNLYDYISWYRKAKPLDNTTSGTYTYDIKTIYSDYSQPWTYGFNYYGVIVNDWDKPIENGYWTNFNVPTKRQRDDMSKFVQPDGGWLFDGDCTNYGAGWQLGYLNFRANFVVKVPKSGPAIFLSSQPDKKIYKMGVVSDMTKASNHNYDSWSDFAFSYLGHNYYYNSSLAHPYESRSVLDFSSATIDEYGVGLDPSNGIFSYDGVENPYNNGANQRSDGWLSNGVLQAYNSIFIQNLGGAGGGTGGFLVAGSLNNQFNFQENDLGIYYVYGYPTAIFCNQNVWNDGDNGKTIYIPLTITLTDNSYFGDTPQHWSGRNKDWAAVVNDLTQWRSIGLPLRQIYAPGSQTLYGQNQDFYSTNPAPTVVYNWDSQGGNFVQQPVYVRDVAEFQRNDYNNQFYINAYNGLANAIVNKIIPLVGNKTNVTTKYEGHLTNIFKRYGNPGIATYTGTYNASTMFEREDCIWGTAGNVVTTVQNKQLLNSNDTLYHILQHEVANNVISTNSLCYQTATNGEYHIITADWTDANADLYYNWPTERSDWEITPWIPPNLANNMRESLQNEYNKNDVRNRWGLSELSLYTIYPRFVGNTYQYYNSVADITNYPFIGYGPNGAIYGPDVVINGKSSYEYNDIFASGSYQQNMYGCYTYVGKSSLRNKLGVQFADNQAKVKVSTIFGVGNTLLEGKQGNTNGLNYSIRNGSLVSMYDVGNYFLQYHKDEHWDSSSTYKFSYGFIENVDASGVINGIRDGKFTPICQSTGGMQWIDLSTGEIHRTLEEVEVDLTPVIDMKPPASGNYYLVFLHYVDPIDLVFKEPKVWWEQPLVDEDTFNYYGQKYGFTVAPHVDSLKTTNNTQNVFSVPPLGTTVGYTTRKDVVDINYTNGNYTTNNQLYLKTTIGVGGDNHYADYLTYYMLPSNGHYQYELDTSDRFTSDGHRYTGRFSDYNNYGITYDGVTLPSWDNQTHTLPNLPILPPALMLKIDKPLYVI